MLKYSYLRKNLSKLTPIQRELVLAHFRRLWNKYDAQVEQYRHLWNRRLITLDYYRRVTKVHRLDLHNQLRSIVRSMGK